MKLDLLVVAAHPDDAEICVGGTLILASEAGLATGVVDVTRGEMGTRGSREDRDREARAASEVMGLAVRRNLEQPDGRVSVSLRSRGRPDVNGVARAFGGGGHTYAAGTTLDAATALDDRRELIAKLRAATTEAFA